jgi:hypothetical protein
MTSRRTSKRGRRYPRRLVPPFLAAVFLASLAGWSMMDGQRGARTPVHAEHVTSDGLPHSQHRAAAPTPASSAAELSLRLQALLGHHSVLAADMMRGRLRGDPDFAQAANAALGKNTAATGQVVGSLFGEQARAQFAPLWASHVTALFNYARGVADHDDAVRDEARAAVANFESKLGVFFAHASQGRLDRAAATGAVRAHIEHLLQQTDAYAMGDYTQADQMYREAYTHTYGLGKILAVALLGPGASAALDSPTWRLRSELGRLLGEHVVLVVAAMRSGVTGSKDFAASAEAVNGNTRDLAGAMDSLYGTAAAKRFQSLWADHVDQLMAYTAAVVTRADRRRAAALAELGVFEQQLASFLATATRKRLASTTLADAFLMHDQMLLREVDAFSAKEYQKAHDLAYSTYEQMSDLSRELSGAIGATIASRLPKGGPQTGGAGMVDVVGRR